MNGPSLAVLPGASPAAENDVMHLPGETAANESKDEIGEMSSSCSRMAMDGTFSRRSQGGGPAVRESQSVRFGAVETEELPATVGSDVPTTYTNSHSLHSLFEAPAVMSPTMTSCSEQPARASSTVSSHQDPTASTHSIFSSVSVGQAAETDAAAGGTPLSPHSPGSNERQISGGSAEASGEEGVQDIKRRRSSFAVGFNIRCQISNEQNHETLGQRRLSMPEKIRQSSTFSLSRSCTSSKILESMTTVSQAWHINQVLQRLRLLVVSDGICYVLQWLSLFSVWCSTYLLTMEPTCEWETERAFAKNLKIVHLCTSIMYILTVLTTIWTFREDFITESHQECESRVLGSLLGFLRRRPQHFDKHPKISNEKRGAETWKPRISFAWLLLDSPMLLALVGEVVHLSDQPAGLPSPWQWLWLLNAVKVWRFLLPAPDRSLDRTTFAFSVFELFVCLMLFTHIFGCFFGFVALIEQHNGQTTWADDVLDREDGTSGCADFYMRALYFSSYTVTSIGYGDVAPVNSVEQGIAAVGMVISQLYLAKVFADLTFLTATHNYWFSEHHKKVTMMTSALASMGVPKLLQERVLAYQDFVLQAQKEQAAQKSLAELSGLLREELQVTLHHRLVMSAPFLQRLTGIALRHIVSKLMDCIFLPADFIFRKGEPGSELYFLRDGNAAIFVTSEAPSWTSEEIRVLGRGEYFGEVAVLTGAARSSWVMARTYCVCSVLHKSAIDEVMSTDPTCVVSLAKSMTKSLDKKRDVDLVELGNLLENEFIDSDEMFEFACSGRDGEAPSGIITWNRYQLLMQRLCVPILDQKLLWIDMDSCGKGSITFTELMEAIECFNDDLVAPHSSLPRTHTALSLGTSLSASLSTSSTAPLPLDHGLTAAEKRPSRRLSQRKSRHRRSSAEQGVEDLLYDHIQCISKNEKEIKDAVQALNDKVDRISENTQKKFNTVTTQLELIMKHLGCRTPEGSPAELSVDDCDHLL